MGLEVFTDGMRMESFEITSVSMPETMITAAASRK